jgi:hypothetical protein
MSQYVNGRIGVFDAGTSDRNSISLWFPAKCPGTPVLHGTQQWEQEAETGTLLPKHRSWSGGLFFTLPGDDLSVRPPKPEHLFRGGDRYIDPKTSPLLVQAQNLRRIQ